MSEQQNLKHGTPLWKYRIKIEAIRISGALFLLFVTVPAAAFAIRISLRLIIAAWAIAGRY